MNVVREGRALRLNWDRDAAVVRDATHAVLHISDGKHQSEMNLDQQSLQSGTASYWPESREVGFRLELFSAGGTASGEIQAPGALAEEQEKPSPFAEPHRPAKRRARMVEFRSPAVAEPQKPPRHPSRWARTVGKIPLLRRLKKSPQRAD